MSAPALTEAHSACDDAAPPPTPASVAPAGLWIRVGITLLVVGVALAALLRGAVHSIRGAQLDASLMTSVGHSATAYVRITDALTVVSVSGVGLFLLICMVTAIVRRRYSLALGALVVIAGANLTTQVMKYHLVHRADGASNHLPSGHTTVALSLGLAAILVAPIGWRWLMVPVAGFAATFVGAGTIVGQWHTPSDVLAAILVCLGWNVAAIAISAVMQQRNGHRVGRWAARSWLALPGAAAAGVVFVSWGVRPQDGDVNLVQAAFTLGVIGVCCALAVSWSAALCERYLG